jgi:hypothetical protein
MVVLVERRTKVVGDFLGPVELGFVAQGNEGNKRSSLQIRAW